MHKLYIAQITDNAMANKINWDNIYFFILLGFIVILIVASFFKGSA